MKKVIYEFSYDPIAKAIYIRLTDKDVAITRRRDDNVFLDFDKNNNLVGIEIIRVRKGSMSFTVRIHRAMNRIADQFHIPALKKIHPEKFVQACT